MKYFYASLSMFLALSTLVMAIADDNKIKPLLIIAALSCLLHGLYLEADDDDFMGGKE